MVKKIFKRNVLIISLIRCTKRPGNRFFKTKYYADHRYVVRVTEEITDNRLFTAHSSPYLTVNTFSFFRSFRNFPLP